MTFTTRAALGAVAIVAAGCGGSGGGNDADINNRPDYIKGTIVSTTYDGVSNDLLTGGLGKSGLQSATPPVPASPTNPTAAEIRTIAIYNNYRALLDPTPNGGFGVLYGPNIDVNGSATLGEGKVAGEEHLAFADDGSGSQNVTLMVQIPASFSLDSPCIVSATSSGSRGVYGAIATAGEWGLKHGCAVAYSDKGTGTGYHDLTPNAVYTMQGLRTSASSAGTNAIFNANLSSTDLAAFNTSFPNRWATKHAHSQQNPEATWGRDTLRAIEFAFYMLNQKFGTDAGNGKIVRSPRLLKQKVIVIASSVSNGGGAAIAAAEQDTDGLIDGIAVGEPQMFFDLPPGVSIKRGATTLSTFGRTLYDYFTFADLMQPCAALSTAAAGSPFAVLVNATTAANRCTALAAKGLVSGATTTDRANDAMAKLIAYGWDQDTTLFHASHYALATLSVTLTYANAYSRSSVKDNLCGYSFGATPVNGVPPPIAAATAAQLFGTSNGVPPSSSAINIINNNSVGGAALDSLSISPSTGVADFNIDGAACLRDLLTASSNAGQTLRSGINAAKRTGNLRGKPAIIVHGRSDTLVPPSHASRAYYALNKIQEPSSLLSYIEVQNAQHFDSFLPLAGYDTRLVPLHRYFIQAMDLVYANLRSGAALPPSQVVRTTPRGGSPGAAPAISASNVPPIKASPASADQIKFDNNVLSIPD
jgi:hydroxybutyrate-dimer hydrolase